MVLTRAKAAQAAAAAAQQERANNIAAAAQRSNTQSTESSNEDDTRSIAATLGRGSRARTKKAEEPATIIIATEQSNDHATGMSSSDPIVIDDNVGATNPTPVTPFEQFLRNEFLINHSAGGPKPQRSLADLTRERNRMTNERRREHKMMLRFAQETENTTPPARPAITAVPETPSLTISGQTSQAEAGKALDATLDEILNAHEAEILDGSQAEILNLPQAETGIFKMHESRLRALPDMSSRAGGGGLLQLSTGGPSVSPNAVASAVPKKVTGANDIEMGPSRFTSSRRVIAQPSHHPTVPLRPIIAEPVSPVPPPKPVQSTTSVMQTVDTLQAILGRNFMNRRFLFQAAPAISSGNRSSSITKPAPRKFSQLGEAAHKLAFFEKHHEKVPYNVQQLYNSRRMNSNVDAVAKQSGLVAFAGPNPTEKLTTQLVLALIGATHLDGGLGAAVAAMEKLNLL